MSGKSGSPPTGKKSAGKKGFPKANTGALSVKQDAPSTKPTVGKSKMGAKRKGSR